MNFEKNWNEFAVKNVYKLVKTDKDLMSYMPSEEMDEDRFPDKYYFWNLMNTLRPTWTEKYIEMVMTNRRGTNPKPVNTKIVKVGPFW